MIVVDTNVLAYLLVASDATRSAREVYARDPEWSMPSLWRHELLNVLALYVRAGGVEPKEAVAAWLSASRLLRSGERASPMLRAMQLALELGVSAYDAQFLALAERLCVPLVTADRRLRQAAGPRALSMTEFLSQPVDPTAGQA